MTMSTEANRKDLKIEKTDLGVVNEVSVKSNPPVFPVKVDGQTGPDKPSGIEVGVSNEPGPALDLEPYRGNTQFVGGDVDPSEIRNRQPGRAYRRVNLRRIERENNDRGWQLVQGKDPEKFVNASSRLITPRPNDASDNMQTQGDLALAWKPSSLKKQQDDDDQKRANSSVRNLKDVKEKVESDFSRLGIDPSVARVKEGVVNMMTQSVSRQR